MLIIGLTGSTGAGKSYVALLLSKRGIPSIDCDAVCHEVYNAGEDCNSELCSYFGSDILDLDGNIDRKKLRVKAFASPENYSALNEIAHRHILLRVNEYIERYREENIPALLIDAPLLFESGFDKFCDKIISVIADRETQISRVTQRDGITPDIAEQRLSKQKTNDFYTENADYIIDNSDKNRDFVKDEVNALAEEIIKL